MHSAFYVLLLRCHMFSYFLFTVNGHSWCTWEEHHRVQLYLPPLIQQVIWLVCWVNIVISLTSLLSQLYRPVISASYIGLLYRPVISASYIGQLYRPFILASYIGQLYRPVISASYIGQLYRPVMSASYIGQLYRPVISTSYIGQLYRPVIWPVISASYIGRLCHLPPCPASYNAQIFLRKYPELRQWWSLWLCYIGSPGLIHWPKSNFATLSYSCIPNKIGWEGGGGERSEDRSLQHTSGELDSRWSMTIHCNKLFPIAKVRPQPIKFQVIKSEQLFLFDELKEAMVIWLDNTIAAMTLSSDGSMDGSLLSAAGIRSFLTLVIAGEQDLV